MKVQDIELLPTISLTSWSNTRCAARSDFSGAVSSRIDLVPVAISRAFERESAAANSVTSSPSSTERVSQIGDDAFGSTVQLWRYPPRRAGLFGRFSRVELCAVLGT